MPVVRGKSLALIIISAFLLVGLMLTLFYTRQRQEIRSRAQASTTLSFSPTTVSSTINSDVSLDIMISPGNNIVSFVALDILYDPALFALPDTGVAITPNTNALPVVVEGPLYTNGRIRINLSSGNDTARAIVAPIKIATLKLKANSITSNMPTQIRFGQETIVLSIGSESDSSENVLSSTQAASVTINGVPTPTPTTPPLPTPTLTPAPTFTPTPTPIVATPTPILSTKLGLTVSLHGIGSSGDNANPTNSTFSNKNPLHPTRQINILIYNSDNTLMKNMIGDVTYNSANGRFIGTIDLGFGLPTGLYSVRVKPDQFLRRLVPGFITLTSGITNQVTPVTLVSGDINNDNQLNILDYNILIGCYSDLLPAKSCTQAQKLASDISDDGSVNQTDYNLFLREISVQAGE